MERQKVLLSTSLMYKMTPAFPGQEPIARHRERREIIPLYSTGKLEEALEKGMEVFIVSILSGFKEHDQWWIRLVEAENIYHSEWPTTRTCVKHFLLKLLDVWRSLYERLGLEWAPPQEFERFDTPGIKLVTHYGFVDGSVLKGFGGALDDPKMRLWLVFGRLSINDDGRKLVANAIPEISPETAGKIADRLEAAAEDIEETERLLREILDNFSRVA